MRPRVLAAAGVVLVLGAAWLRPVPGAAHGGALGALGRSLGGLRVMAVDALFLRAEAQRKRGRVEDAAALYQAVLELEPDNEAAAAFLADTYVDELLPQLADPAERFAWWQEARGLLERAAGRHPRSGELQLRLAMLVLDVPRVDPGLGRRIAAALGDPNRVALRHLRRSLVAGATLPRLGRMHLVRIAGLAPVVAAHALREGADDALEEARAVARETLEHHAAVLAEVHWGDSAASPSLEALLRRGMEAVDAVAALRAGGGDAAEARARVAGYAALVPPGAAALEDLRAVLEAPR